MTEQQLQQAVFDRMDGWAERALGPSITTAWSSLVQRLRLHEGPGYFLHPLALPVLQLPLWAAQVAGFPAELALDAAEGAAVGYLHVRIQDDLLDEGQGGSAADLMLAEALIARHQRLCSQVAAGRGAWAERFEALWLGYAEAMALEDEVTAGRVPYTAERFERLLERSGPLALPPLSVLCRAEHQGLERVEAIVRLLSRAHQLFTDAVDVEKDLTNGNPSWVLVRAGLDEGIEVVRRRLYLEGGLDAVIAEAAAELDRAAALAGELELPGVAGWVEARKEIMEQARQEAFTALFNQLLRGNEAVVE